MRIQKALCHLVAASAVFAGANQVTAGEPNGLFHRFFPAFHREDNPETATSNTTRADEVLFEIQKRREETQAIDDEIEIRVRDIVEHRVPITVGAPAFAGADRPTLEELREHLISRGVDPRNIDRRIERVAESASRGQLRAAERRMLNRGVNSNSDPVSVPPGTSNDDSGALDSTNDLSGDLGDQADISSAMTEFAQQADFDQTSNFAPEIDQTGEEIRIRETAVMDLSNDVIDLPVDQSDNGFEIGDVVPFDVIILPVELDQTAETVPSTEIVERTMIDPQTVVDQAITNAGETATAHANTEAPVSTVVTPSFHRSGAGLRGGFGRGRVRD